MNTLVPYIRRWITRRNEYMRVFADSDSRLEGWFKGELLLLFTKLKRRGVISGFRREVGLKTSAGKRYSVDFVVEIGRNSHLCELKAPCISQAAGTPRNLQFYFRNNRVGLLQDFKKLDRLRGRNKWALAFIYPRPSKADWNAALSSIPRGLKHWRPVTNWSSASKSVFISLWRPKYRR